MVSSPANAFFVSGSNTGTDGNCKTGHLIGIEKRFFDSEGAWLADWASMQTASAVRCRSGSQSTGTLGTIPEGAYGVALRLFETATSGGTTGTPVAIAKTTAEFEVPDAPSLGCAGTYDGIDLEWTFGGSLAADGFEVERSSDLGTTWAAVGPVLDGARRAWENRPQPFDLERTYRIRTTNGPSEWSNECTATTHQTDTGEAIPTPDVTDPGDGEDEGESCAVWNLFCHVVKAGKWLLIPPSTTWDAWDGIYDDLESKPPFSVGIGGVGFIVEFLDEIYFRYDSGGGTCTGQLVLPDVSDPTEQGETLCPTGDWAEFAASSEYVSWNRILLGWLAMLGTAWRIWHVLGTAFGSGSSEEPPVGGTESEAKDS